MQPRICATSAVDLRLAEPRRPCRFPCPASPAPPCPVVAPRDSSVLMMLATSSASLAVGVARPWPPRCASAPRQPCAWPLPLPSSSRRSALLLVVGAFCFCASCSFLNSARFWSSDAVRTARLRRDVGRRLGDARAWRQASAPATGSGGRLGLGLRLRGTGSARGGLGRPARVRAPAPARPWAVRRGRRLLRSAPGVTMADVLRRRLVFLGIAGRLRQLGRLSRTRPPTASSVSTIVLSSEPSADVGEFLDRHQIDRDRLDRRRLERLPKADADDRERDQSGMGRWTIP